MTETDAAVEQHLSQAPMKPKQNAMSIVIVIVGIAMIAMGAWSVALAVHDGNVTGVLWRFGLAVFGGLYYAVLYLWATGRRFFATRVNDSDHKR